MQRKSPLTSTLCAIAIAVAGAALLAPAARAAELGEASVRSYIGQQLAADIELVSLTPDEVNGLQVRLAPADVYQGASITINPALTTAHLAVVRREQRQFLHITTLKAVDAGYLHLFLELGVPGHFDVRAATLWLQPDPHPAPPPAPLVVAVPVAGSAASAAGLEAAAETALRAGRPGASRAASGHPARDVVGHDAVGAAPAGTKFGPESSRAIPRHALAVPPAVRAPAGAACATNDIRPSAKECVVLDRQNAALSDKLVELEGKVKVLQTALDGKRAPDSNAVPDNKPMRAHIPPRAGAAAGASRPGLAKLKYKKEKPVETGPDMVTVAAAGGVLLLALAGGGYYWLRRRKQAGQDRAPLKIWQGWRRKKGATATPEEAPRAEEDALNQSQ
jgi:pilus assembly protein FimV